MIDQLPYEVLLRICELLDPPMLYPDHIFRNQFRPDLTFLSQTCKPIRRQLLPVLIRHLSLVRKHEKQVSTNGLRSSKSNLILSLINGFETYVDHLEVHSSSVVEQLEKFRNLTSLTILGDTQSWTSDFSVEVTGLTHLAIQLPGVHLRKVKFKGLKRLDLLIGDETTSDSFMNFQDSTSSLSELNLTITSSSGILRSWCFIQFIKSFQTLSKLSIRMRSDVSTQSSDYRLINSDFVSFTDFMDAILQLQITNLTIDLPLIRTFSSTILSYLESYQSQELSRDKKSLSITLIETAFSIAWSTQQELTVLSFLNKLTESYVLKSLKFVFGIQSEVLPMAPVLVLRNILSRSVSSRGVDRYLTIPNIFVLMAWNIIDERFLLNYQEYHPHEVLSYQRVPGCSPTYKKLLKLNMIRDQSNVSFNRDLKFNSGDDLDFWSSEIISKDLITYARQRKSNLWD